MKFDKDPMNATIQEPTHWDPDILDCVIITSEHLWDPDSTNDALEDSMIIPNINEVEGNDYNYLHQLSAADMVS